MARNNEKISLLIKKLKSINESIFFDLLVDNLNNEVLERNLENHLIRIRFFLKEKLELLKKLMNRIKNF